MGPGGVELTRRKGLTDARTARRRFRIRSCLRRQLAADLSDPGRGMRGDLRLLHEPRLSGEHVPAAADVRAEGRRLRFRLLLGPHVRQRLALLHRRRLGHALCSDVRLLLGRRLSSQRRNVRLGGHGGPVQGERRLRLEQLSVVLHQGLHDDR